MSGPQRALPARSELFDGVLSSLSELGAEIRPGSASVKRLPELSAWSKSSNLLGTGVLTGMTNTSAPPLRRHLL